jgi:pimeloyl-ACP methyl ester carboxylesterase
VTPAHPDVGVLLLHGLGGCSFQLEGAAQALPHALAPDAPYHGGRGIDGELTFVAAARDALACADRAGLRRFLVAGMSMGAATAMTIASLTPSRVTGLVAISPAWLDVPFPPNLDRLRKLGRRLAAQGTTHAWLVASSVPPVDGWEPPAREAYRERFLAYDAAATGLAMQELPGVLPLVDERALAAMDGPRLVMTWPDDPIHPEALAREVAEAIDAPPAWVLRRPRRYHEEQRLLAELVRQVQQATAPTSPNGTTGPTAAQR